MQKMVALVFVLTVIAFSAPASAYTHEEEMACKDDAFRLCQNAIPDEQRVKMCLIANLRKLSPSCKSMFQRARR
ncbi:MAG TPA: hypothetical protein VH640_05455 [Bryobacteraceae bacterium]